MRSFENELIVSIVNTGFSPVVMDAAKKAGALGGTVFHGRGTANSEAEKLFQIAVHPDKEILLIIVKTEIRDEVLKAVNQAGGLETPGQGIAFSLPVDRTIGFGQDIKPFPDEDTGGEE